MKSAIVAIAVALSFLSSPAMAQRKDCEELKAEIAKKIEANGVKSYTLNIVGNDDVKDQTVVGSCDGGAKKIVYKRN